MEEERRARARRGKYYSALVREMFHAQASTSWQQQKEEGDEEIEGEETVHLVASTPPPVVESTSPKRRAAASRRRLDFSQHGEDEAEEKPQIGVEKESTKDEEKKQTRDKDQLSARQKAQDKVNETMEAISSEIARSRGRMEGLFADLAKIPSNPNH
ncbi:hypothetical protein QOT17_006730 [Balamuthia mandrillaris]